MSIIDCPQCGKRTSSRAPICDHCGYAEGETNDEARQRFRERKIRNQLYRLNMASYAAMTIVILAFGWYWLATDGLNRPSDSIGPYFLMMVGALAYLGVRVMMFLAKKKRKAIWQNN
ncbi:MAG TPA: zinc ribbon domain-containing protein [Xanthomonadales bacterium]|nr:zinc ribbon domain-containing protein [Xanthomonadales bacterium]